MNRVWPTFTRSTRVKGRLVVTGQVLGVEIPLRRGVEKRSRKCGCLDGEIVTMKSRVTDHVGGRNALTGAYQ